MSGEYTDFVVEADVRVAYKDHWEAFQERWKQLPPLVRASCASWLINVLDNSADQHARNMAKQKVCGLDRRAKISEAFGRSDRTVAQLFVALCKEADAEAVAKGIDADIKPEPVEGKQTWRLATRTWEDSRVAPVEKKPKPKPKRKKK